MQLVRIQPALRGRGVEHEAQRQGFGQGVAHQLVDAGHAVIHVHQAGLHGVLARERQQATDQVGAPAGRLDGRGNVLAHMVLHIGLLAQRGEVAQHHGQDVVEIVRHAAGELAQGFHLLRLHQHVVRAALLGDVEGQLEAADHPGTLVYLGDLGNERGAGQPPHAAHGHHFVLESHRLAAQGLADVGFDERIGAQPQKLARTHPLGVGRIERKPVAVAPVDVAVGQVGIEIRHQRGDGVGDQAHLGLAALQRAGELAVQAQRLAQLVVGGHQLGGALGHARLQQGVLFADQLF